MYVLGLLCIYVHKQDISKGWTSKEQIVIDKIDEISIKLYNEVRKDLISKNPDLYEKANKKIQVDKKRETDGLEFIINYIPEIDSNKDNNMTTELDNNMITELNRNWNGGQRA